MLKEIQGEIGGADEAVEPLNFKFNFDDNVEDLDSIDIYDYDQDDVDSVEKNDRKPKSSRKRWTEEEIEEIQQYFAKFLKTKTCPSKTNTLKAIEKSNTKRGGGHSPKDFGILLSKKILT